MTQHNNHCTFCEGHGYQEVIVGGSETCPVCEGTGKEDK